MWRVILGNIGLLLLSPLYLLLSLPESLLSLHHLCRWEGSPPGGEARPGGSATGRASRAEDGGWTRRGARWQQAGG